jgi:hypothetical protein
MLLHLSDFDLAILTCMVRRSMVMATIKMNFCHKYVYYIRLILICRKNIDGAAILKFKDLAATCCYSIWCFIIFLVTLTALSPYL